MATRFAPSERSAGRLRGCTVCGYPVLVGDIARKQGPCRRACRRDRRGQGYGDQSHGSRCLCIAYQRGSGAPAYPDIPGHEPDVSAARRRADAISKAMGELRRVLPIRGSYVSESNFFNDDWREAFWGRNYTRLLAVKDKYDPEGLFIVHHGVGSERWSADGFSKLPKP